MYLAGMDIKTAFDVARPKRTAKIMGDQAVHGWITAALLKEMAGLAGQATFEHVENNSFFRDASVRGALRHLGFGSKLQRRSCGMLSQSGREKRWESTLTHAKEENIKPAVLCGADIYCRLSHLKDVLGADDMDLIEEAERWELEPASLCVDKH